MLEIRGLAKRYANGRGVGPLDLSVGSGEVVAIVGPNGAGKSTAFDSLAGVVEFDAGRLVVDGRECSKLPQDGFGLLPERPFLFESLTPRQTCQFERAMRRLDVTDEGIARCLAAFGCEAYLDERIGTLSQGMAKRVAVACAFLGSPRVILLDEPTNALDVKTTLALKDAVRGKASEGCSVLVSSHVLDFLDGVADRGCASCARG